MSSCGTCETCRSGCVHIDKFVDRVMANSAGAPRHLVQDKVQETVQDFAGRTGIIKRVISFETQACVDEYFLKPPCGELIQSVDKVTDRDCYCPEAARERPYNDHLCQDLYFFERPCTLYISPQPKCDGTKIYVEATMIPQRDACEVDRRFFDYHSEAIVAGTIVEMASMSQSEWFAAGVVSSMQAKWEEKIDCAVAMKQRQFSRKPMRFRSGFII